MTRSGTRSRLRLREQLPGRQGASRAPPRDDELGGPEDVSPQPSSDDSAEPVGDALGGLTAGMLGDAQQALGRGAPWPAAGAAPSDQDGPA